VGHAFTADVLLAEQRASVEAARWTALRALDESTEMAQRLESRVRSRGGGRAAAMYARNAETYEQRASILRALLRDTAEPLTSTEDGPTAHAIG
jgi:two-component system chemotaxis response regulator CheB